MTSCLCCPCLYPFLFLFFRSSRSILSFQLPISILSAVMPWQPLIRYFPLLFSPFFGCICSFVCRLYPCEPRPCIFHVSMNITTNIRVMEDVVTSDIVEVIVGLFTRYYHQQFEPEMAGGIWQ